MNPRVITVFAFLLTSFTATATAAGASSDRPYAFPVTSALSGQHQIRLGTIDQDVVDAFGVPNLRASENVWLYYRNHTQERDLVGNTGCSILVVTFTHARVSDLKLVNAGAAKLIASEAKSGTIVGFVAEKLPTVAVQQP